ncbi:hypothetical protein CK203_052177 [Vitis vinifera]|uniref:Uncharacterized protein n=1 Tax=Vitis vinifera TaxID=29760 RepID=A0A438GA15_VITVI|nr:hypothetical protein CK203_052177 [Vitis vinifera]
MNLPPPPPLSSSSSSTSTSKLQNKWSPAPADLKMDRRKKQRPRNPLKDLNHVATTISSTNSSSSSSQSIEVPRGCLRFLLSNSSSSKSPRYRPKALSKTPKSAPNARISKPSKSKPRKENIPKRAVGDELHKPKKNPPCLYQWQSRGPHKTKPNANSDKISSGSEDLKQKGCLVRGVDEAGEAIQASLRGVPMKILLLNNKTPPVQPSVSPEIQCGSSLMAITPACYGAGHVLSGVTDKRKCRARGILTIGENHMLSFDKCKAFDNDVQSGVGKKDENLKEGSENPCGRLALSPSPLSDMCNFSDKTTNTITSSSSIDRRSRKSLLSPTGLHEFQGFPGSLSDYMVGCSSLSPLHVTPCCKAQEETKYRYSLVEESTPISMRTDSLGSGNVIQTPQSDSSSDRHAGSSLLNADVCKDRQFESELDSLAEVLQMTSFSPKSHISMWDPSGLSSQFDQLPTPYNSIDLSRLQKTLERASWNSSSTLENVSHSQMRISWREGLISRIFEMDELDCCRCLSDEEEDANGCSDDQLKSHLSPGLNVDVGNDQILTADFGSSKFLDCKPGADRKGKEKLLPQRPIACAESVSTDGGGLVASGDSDWTLCYKNHLFEE